MRLLALCAALLLSARPVPAQPIQRLARPDHRGTAWSVRAPDGPLVFTAMISATDPAADTRSQAARALAALERVLADSGSDASRVLRLNAYVSGDAEVAAVEQAVAERFAAQPPAFVLLHTNTLRFTLGPFCSLS